jgi:hypothetical protein
LPYVGPHPILDVAIGVEVPGRKEPLIKISVQPVFFEFSLFQFIPLQLGIAGKIHTVGTILVSHMIENNVGTTESTKER